MTSSKKFSFVQEGDQERLQLSFGLMALIWIVGFAGHFTPLREWPALTLYVIGSLSLVLFQGVKRNGWKSMYMAGGHYKKSLLWGGGAGALLFFMALFNTHNHYENGGAAMDGMEALLRKDFLLYLFPVLVLAEELFWRGIMASSLAAYNVNRHIIVLVTTLCFALNHFAVAPVAMEERLLMAIMALPLGIAGGYITLGTKNVWGSVVVHMSAMISMFIGMQMNT
ncbi:CPBP family intramembrane metalloprotease [Prosthecochloris marina]|uniref:CPBP family intramembrane metalloprotease n=1 Tax=Prosthecochloris marina TaxID=2017681 RepID=A0A317T828_9CHLB|nr:MULTISPECIES: type II CAAX endopeptidase family protein [Prosthecochloris]PWW81571.1 CPBP family intramembrane metalloprotease [Prosthecochloris marina]UZJ39961.1 CPBP family intramembrane metalloprotease [Prosthecochloris sp. SCSIO W1102]